MTQMMTAMRLTRQETVEGHPLQRTRVPVPVPGPGQVRLKIRMCGVCHTDLHAVEGDIHPPHLPVTLGHQVVGEVDAVGEEPEPGEIVDHPRPEGERIYQAREHEIQVGDRVGVPWLYSVDGTCIYCRSGQENLCPNARFTGFHVDGGFAEYMLAERDFVLPLPESLSDEQSAPLLCAGIIGYRSLRQADLQPGERLGLVGFGASAHLAIQVARYWRCPVYVFTRSEEHRRHAEALGAAWTGGAEDDAPELLDRAVIFAPAGRLVPVMLEKIRPGGTLAINAIHMSPIPEIDYSLIYGERTLRSVANATYQDGLEFLNLAAAIPVEATTSRYSLEEVNQALEDLKHSRLNGEAVLKIT